MATSRRVGSLSGFPFSTTESKLSMAASPPAIRVPPPQLRRNIKTTAPTDGASIWETASGSDVEKQGEDARDQNGSHGDGNDREPSQDSDVVGPEGHGSDLPIYQVHPKDVSDIIRTAVRRFLEEHPQLRIQCGPRGPLLGHHATMQLRERHEEQEDAERNQGEEKSSDADKVADCRCRSRCQEGEEEEGDETEVDGCQGERQRTDRPQSEERVLVVRLELQRSPAEAPHPRRNAPIRPDDGGDGERDHRKADDVDDRREEFQEREGPSDIEPE